MLLSSTDLKKFDKNLREAKDSVCSSHKCQGCPFENIDCEDFAEVDKVVKDIKRVIEFKRVLARKRKEAL